MRYLLVVSIDSETNERLHAIAERTKRPVRTVASELLKEATERRDTADSPEAAGGPSA
jgi:predicted transcriptional regulator